jgi:hypothetical protein
MAISETAIDRKLKFSGWIDTTLKRKNCYIPIPEVRPHPHRGVILGAKSEVYFGYLWMDFQNFFFEMSATLKLSVYYSIIFFVSCIKFLANRPITMRG